MDAHNGGVEAQNGAMEGFRPVVVDLHHFDEELDRDPDPHEKSDPGRIKVKNGSESVLK